MEKQQINNGKIDKLVTPEGTFVDEPSSMLGLVKSFYSDLYSAKVESRGIPDDICEDLENDISKDEVRVALSQMNTNKSPGLDGLTVEFYPAMWPFIEHEFIDVLKVCYNKGQLCKSMNTGLIRLIYKMKGSKFDLKNWRPISLLNVNYRILAKIHTNRLKKAMPFLIGNEQTSGVPGRNIYHNLMFLRDSIDFINWMMFVTILKMIFLKMRLE